MNIPQLLKQVNDKARIKELIYSPSRVLREFLMSYGYLLSEENIRDIFTSIGITVIADIMSAYTPDDILDDLHISTILQTPQLVRRLSRKQIKERASITDLRTSSHYTATELCAVIKNCSLPLKNDYPFTAIAARKLYSYVVKNGCSLETAPYVFKYVMPYANRPQMHRLISRLWQEYRKMSKATLDYEIGYTFEGNTEICNAFISALPHTSMVSSRDAVRFAHIMLTAHDHTRRRIIKRVPIGLAQALDFLPHHKLMYLLIFWTAGAAGTGVLWPEDSIASAIGRYVAAMMRLGHLCARMPSALRLKVGIAFPGIVNRRMFTRAEISKLAVIRGISNVGHE